MSLLVLSIRLYWLLSIGSRILLCNLVKGGF